MYVHRSSSLSNQMQPHCKTLLCGVVAIAGYMVYCTQKVCYDVFFLRWVSGLGARADLSLTSVTFPPLTSSGCIPPVFLRFLAPLCVPKAGGESCAYALDVFLSLQPAILCCVSLGISALIKIYMRLMLLLLRSLLLPSLLLAAFRFMPRTPWAGSTPWRRSPRPLTPSARKCWWMVARACPTCRWTCR